MKAETEKGVVSGLASAGGVWVQIEFLPKS